MKKKSNYESYSVQLGYVTVDFLYTSSLISFLDFHMYCELFSKMVYFYIVWYFRNFCSVLCCLYSSFFVVVDVCLFVVQWKVLFVTVHQYLYLFSVCCISFSVHLCSGTLELIFYKYKPYKPGTLLVESQKKHHPLCSWRTVTWEKVNKEGEYYSPVSWFEIINCTLDESGIIRITFLISSTTTTNTFWKLFKSAWHHGAHCLIFRSARQPRFLPVSKNNLNSIHVKITKF